MLALTLRNTHTKAKRISFILCVCIINRRNFKGSFITINYKSLKVSRENRINSNSRISPGKSGLLELLRTPINPHLNF